MIEKGKRIKNDAAFKRDQKKTTDYIGKPTQIEKFPEFWREKKHRTPEMAWLEKK